MTLNNIEITQCPWSAIAPHVEALATDMAVESFWEDHVLDSRHYIITCGGDTAGYFAIHGGSTLTLFHVLPPYSKLSMELFARAKRHENVTNAMVPTGDELFISHCFDNFVRVEKQAFLSIYTEREPSVVLPLTLRKADIDSDAETLALAGDFLEAEIKQIRDGLDVLHLYIAEMDGKTVGFGVVQHGRIAKCRASIGMFTLPELRRRGVASNILHQLKMLVNREGFAAMSGCWYYNYNSKQSMESAGGHCKTRLLRFHF